MASTGPVTVLSSQVGRARAVPDVAFTAYCARHTPIEPASREPRLMMTPKRAYIKPRRHFSSPASPHQHITRLLGPCVGLASVKDLRGAERPGTSRVESVSKYTCQRKIEVDEEFESVVGRPVPIPRQVNRRRPGMTGARAGAVGAP